MDRGGPAGPLASNPALLWVRDVRRIGVFAFTRALGTHARGFHRRTYLDWRDHFWSLADRNGWRVYYLGGSLGGIMGNVFMAYDPFITRGALGVPGGAWTMLFERSIAWSALRAAAQGSYTDPREYQMLIALLGMRFEPYDPITTAPRVVADPLPGTPAKQILMYEAIGDCLVNNYSTETVVRTMGLSLVMPSVKMPWSIPPVVGTVTSGFTIYDEHPSPLPATATNVQPLEDNGTHSGVNKRQAVLDSVRAFVLGGQVTQACHLGENPAACDCATGACGPRL